MAKILIVDDSVVCAKFAANYLKKAGHLIILAKNGQKAIELVSKDKPDLILLDVEMPVLDGWETCNALKSNNATKTIPVVMCTSDNSRKFIEKAKQLGTASYVVKPYKVEELVSKVDGILRAQKKSLNENKEKKLWEKTMI